MHRATSNAFGAFNSACGDALWWGMVVSYLLIVLMKSVINCNHFTSKCFSRVSMQLFLQPCIPLFIASLNEQYRQQVVAQHYFLVPKLSPSNVLKVTKHNCPYLSSTLVVRKTIISIFQWLFTLFTLFTLYPYCNTFFCILAHFGTLWQQCNFYH